jgi:type VI secretion system secreted protein VgrG
MATFALKSSKARFFIPVIPLVAIALLIPSFSQAAQSPVALGTTSNFAVLAGSTITNTGPTTIGGTAGGDVGLSPGTAFTGSASVTMSGVQHLADSVAVDAKTALIAAYNDAAGRTPVTSVATELGGTTLIPGVYGNPTLGLTGTLTLDAQGDPNAVFIFQSASTLITASSSSVNMINGTQACNVFWQVGSSATFGTSTSFVGHVMAMASITATTGATFRGQLLARDGAVTLDTNTITNDACAAVVPSATPSASPTVTETVAPSASASPTTSETTSPTPSESASASATPSASASAPPSVPEVVTPEESATPSPSQSASESASPESTPVETTIAGGELPNTETPWNLIGLVGAAIALVGSLIWVFRKPRA